MYLDGVAHSASAQYAGTSGVTVDLPEGDYMDIDVTFCICSVGGNSGSYRVYLNEGTHVDLSG